MRKITGLIILMYCSLVVYARQKRMLSLKDVVLLAQSQSARSKQVQTQKEISYYQYLVYKSEFNPQISLYGNAPVFDKEYYGVRQPDGSVSFLAISQSNNNIGFSLSQQLPFSGGELSLNSGFTRFDDLQYKSKQYNTTPIYLKLSQPLFAFNRLKWNRIIEPLKLEESTKQYVLEQESIAQQTVSLYFDILEAHNNCVMAEVNVKNTEENYETEKKRVSLGTTTEDRLLQLELQSLRSRQDLEKAKYDEEVAQMALKSFIRIKNDEEFLIDVPAEIPQLSVSLQKALEYTEKNRPEFIAFERQKQEAKRDMAQAKAEKHEINFIASYGYNNAAATVNQVYQHLNQQQQLSLGFNIPLVDWGRRKARYDAAKAIEKLTEVNIEASRETILLEITTLVKNIDVLKLNVMLARKTDSVAQRRFSIANSLYQLGKLSVTDLNLAQSEKDNARRISITALRAYWNACYTLRRLTLYDFETNNPL